MGERPEGHTIERLDVDGDYEPGNCVWLAGGVGAQQANRRDTVWVRWRGERVRLVVLCARFGVVYRLVIKRLRRGWLLERALSAPARRYTKR